MPTDTDFILTDENHAPIAAQDGTEIFLGLRPWSTSQLYIGNKHADRILAMAFAQQGEAMFGEQLLLSAAEILLPLRGMKGPFLWGWFANLGQRNTLQIRESAGGRVAATLAPGRNTLVSFGPDVMAPAAVAVSGIAYLEYCIWPPP